jgi:hypothetical protein
MQGKSQLPVKGKTQGKTLYIKHKCNAKIRLGAAEGNTDLEEKLGRESENGRQP